MFDSSAIEAELLRRAHNELAQTHLLVDYYRIRRRIAFPLPVKHVPPFADRIGTVENYPWATWLIWTLEQRILTLGWAGELCIDRESEVAARCRDAVSADLAAMAQWPQHHNQADLDLLLAHACRSLATAYLHWAWLPQEVRDLMATAMDRIVQKGGPAVEARWGKYPTLESILAEPEPKLFIHNIPVLGAFGVGLVAHAVRDDKAAAQSDTHLRHIFRTLLHLRGLDYSEGIGYDGHVMDVLLDWLALQPEDFREECLQHPQFDTLLNETFMAGAPGDVLQTAPLSDVEPDRMRLHAATQAKAALWQPSNDRLWYLGQLDLAEVPAGTLPALHALAAKEPLPPSAPACDGVLNAHYLRVQRTGWGTRDMAVVTAVSTSPFGHIHCNNGTLVIGTGGQWLLTAPGYQQYLPTSEREFSFGPVARNTPLIDGHTLERREVRVIFEGRQDDATVLELDLTGCYPEDLGVKVTRKVTQTGNHVRVEDTFEGTERQSVEYYWHGHAGAFWNLEENAATILLDGSSLRISSPQVAIMPADLHRLKGSRGQLTLHLKPAPHHSVIQWDFLVTPAG